MRLEPMLKYYKKRNEFCSSHWFKPFHEPTSSFVRATRNIWKAGIQIKTWTIKAWSHGAFYPMSVVKPERPVTGLPFVDIFVAHENIPLTSSRNIHGYFSSIKQSFFFGHFSFRQLNALSNGGPVSCIKGGNSTGIFEYWRVSSWYWDSMSVSRGYTLW